MTPSMRQKVEEWLAAHGPADIPAIVKGAGVSRPTAVKWLEVLNTEGALAIDRMRGYGGYGRRLYSLRRSGARN